ncbi:MAG TPA: HD domain-containing protein [Gemmatimonadaceae bacterium]|nr:HD domain-containing protein [Gemmatimonadaceae bacterium]
MSDYVTILEAAEFAAHRHRDQRRKGKSKRPYVGHCIEVASILASIGKVEDPNVIIAALLHDTVEDTETSREEIRDKFGQAAADLVTEVTDDKSLKKKERKALQIEHAPTLSSGAKLIKVADKISNVREIAHDPPKKWSRNRRWEYFEWAEQVINAMGPIDPEMRLVFDKTVADARALLDETDE